MTGWENFAHGADIGVRGCGPTPAAAFEQAAMALTAVVTDPRLVQSRERVEVECRAPDLELLLYEWLNALVYQMATRHLLLGEFHVRIDGEALESTALETTAYESKALDGLALEGTALGETVDIARHAPAVEVKGATLTELTVAQGPDGMWCAQCVIDV